MQTAYVLFGLCALAFVLVGIISMTGGDSTTSRAMKERLERRAAKQSQTSGGQQGTVSSMPSPQQGDADRGRHAA